MEMGGENGCLANGPSWYEEQLKSFSTYFREDEKYVVDEKLRAACEKDQEKLPPLVGGGANEGSFRRLNFD